jgi:hypothetical protein
MPVHATSTGLMMKQNWAWILILNLSILWYVDLSAESITSVDYFCEKFAA